jgi:hypothetical protein
MEQSSIKVKQTFYFFIYSMVEITIPFQKLSEKAKIPSQATFSDA